MANRDVAQVQRSINLIREARQRLAPGASFRTRILLDMVLLELTRELVSLGGVIEAATNALT